METIQAIWKGFGGEGRVRRRLAQNYLKNHAEEL
jgi:hypothetical protein